MHTKRFLQGMLRALCCLIALALLPWQTARAADITVTTTPDVLDVASESCGASTPRAGWDGLLEGGHVRSQ